MCVLIMTKTVRNISEDSSAQVSAQTKEMCTREQAQNPSYTASKPVRRMRRLRRSAAIRNLLQEYELSISDLIFLVFVEEGLEQPVEISSMPGVFRETENTLGAKLQEAQELGIQACLLFGVSHSKDSCGSDTMRSGGLLDRMIRAAKAATPDMLVIADICFCEYTDHGHCGVLDACGDVDNDLTLDNLARQAVIAAEAGADVLAPSGMMDGMVEGIRDALDEAGFEHLPILSYAVKFASAFTARSGTQPDAALGTTLAAAKIAKHIR